MTLGQFYWLLRVLFNTTLVVSEPDADFQWLLDNGHVTKDGSISYRLTSTGSAFVMDRFQKILNLP